MPRFYYIVSRGDWDLQDRLSRDFAGEPTIEVVMDRRIRERRATDTHVAIEQRRRERRRSGRDIAEQLLDRGYAITEQDD